MELKDTFTILMAVFGTGLCILNWIGKCVFWLEGYKNEMTAKSIITTAAIAIMQVAFMIAIACWVIVVLEL